MYKKKSVNKKISLIEVIFKYKKSKYCKILYILKKVLIDE